MISKNKSKQINSLKLKKYRDKYKLFVVEGTKLVLELLETKYTSVSDVYCTEKWLNLFSDKIPKNTSYIIITESDLKKISSFISQEGILAVARTKEFNLKPDILINELSLALDNIQDPGNLGTIIRTADWFGINNILCTPNTVDLYNPKVIQSTMGAIFRINVFYVDLEQVFKHLEGQVNIYGTLLDGENIYDSKLSKNGIILMGNESKGISKENILHITKKILIPNYSKNYVKTESLNAAIATSIVCSEFKRRKYD